MTREEFIRIIDQSEYVFVDNSGNFLVFDQYCQLWNCDDAEFIFDTTEGDQHTLFDTTDAKFEDIEYLGTL